MKLFDAFVAYKFIKLLSTPFEKTDAFKRGIIDKDGKILKKRSSLIDSDDKKAYPSNVYTLVWNLQKILNKVPIVKTRLGRFATALYLLKEETGVEYSVLAEAFSEYAGLNTKDLLLLEEQGKASAMKNIRLISHLNQSGVQQINERYGDAELSWDELPEDEKYDIADLVFSDREAQKLSKMPKNQIPSRTFKQLQKALTDATEGLVSLVEDVQLDERYGEAELSWDDMPEDERFDLADIAFNGDTRFAKKISKMKWKQVKGAQKMELIKTMQDETDGMVTLLPEFVEDEEFRSWNQMPREEKLELAMIAFEGDEKYAKQASNKKWRQLSSFAQAALMNAMTQATDGAMELTEGLEDDAKYMRGEFADKFFEYRAAKHGEESASNSDKRAWHGMVTMYYGGDTKKAERIDSDYDFAQDVYNGIIDGELPKAPTSFWNAVYGADKVAKFRKSDKSFASILESVSDDRDLIRYELGDQFANSQDMDDREYKIFKTMVDFLYSGREREAKKIDARHDFTNSLIADIEKGKVEKFPKSYFELLDPGFAKDAVKMGLAEARKDKESARDHWRRINSKGVVRPIDRDRYPNREREGLEGPYVTKKSGRVYYYDKKEGKYYDPDTDMYLDVSDVMEGNEILEGVVLTEAKFGDPQINILRKAYADAPKFPSVTSKEYKKGRELLSKLPKDALKQIAKARINFISPIANLMLSDTNPGGKFESVEEAVGASGMPIIAIPSTYRFEDTNTARKFTTAVKTNYGFDTALATQDGRVVHVEFQTKDKRLQKEVRRRIGKMAREMRAQVIGEGSLKWSLEDMSGQYLEEKTLTDTELKLRDKYMKELEKEEDDFKKRYGDDYMSVLAATATKMAKKAAAKAEEVKEATSYTNIHQIQPRSKDWKAGTLYVPQNVETGKGKLHKFKKGDQIMVHPFDSERVVGAIAVDDPMSYFFLAKRKVVLEESTQMNEWWEEQVNERVLNVKNFVFPSEGSAKEFKYMLSGQKDLQVDVNGKEARVAYHSGGELIDRIVSKALASKRGKVQESTQINEWWDDQVNKRSRGWKNGVVAMNFQTYNAAGHTRRFKKGDDIYYHPYDMKGQARDYKLVIAAEDPRHEGTYFAVHPDRLGLKGFDSASGPLMNSESVSLDEAKKQSVFMYEFPDEKSAVKFADEINGMGKQPGLMAVVGHDNDVDVYSDKELMKVKISGLADKHGGKFTGQSKQFREEIGTTTAGVAGLTPDTAGRPVSRKKKKEAEERTRRMTEDRLPKHKGLVKEYKGTKVFQVNPDVYEKVSTRSKGERWSKTLPEGMDGIKAIREYSLRNPNKPIIIQNNESGDMKYIRRRLNDQRLRHNRKSS